MLRKLSPPYARARWKPPAPSRRSASFDLFEALGPLEKSNVHRGKRTDRSSPRRDPLLKTVNGEASPSTPRPKFSNLWSFTSHRFLFKESARYDSNYFEFSTAGLVEVARSIVGRSETETFPLTKTGEGDNYRDIRVATSPPIHFRLYFGPAAMQDGLLALRTASQVATMDLARSLGAPVPKVLRYHCTQDNAVGQPFIAFSDPGGSVISNLWMDIDDRERLKLGHVAADLQAKLSAVEFPAYGNIYYTRDLPYNCKSYPIPDRGELKGLCVGPFCSPHYEPLYFHRSRRPYKNPRIFALNTAAELSLKKKEGSYVSPLTHPDEVARFKYTKLYEDYLKILPHLLPLIDAAMNAPRLVVDSVLPLYYFDKPLLTASRDIAIAAILDFGKFFIRPSFHQGRASTTSMVPNIPQMPREPKNISSKQQELIAKQLMSWRVWMVKTKSFDKTKYIDGADDAKWGLLRELFAAIKLRPHKHNRLHCALIRVTEQWDDITRTKDGHVPPCPISYPVEEKEETLREEERLDAVRAEWRFFCTVTGTKADGAVSAHDYERASRYYGSLQDRVNANGGKHFPDVDVSDSTGETFETPDDFETALCKRMGISRQTFWRTVVDAQPEPTFSEGASRDQPVLSALDDLYFTPDKEEQ